MINRVSDSYKKHIVSIAFGPLLKIIEAIFDLLIPLFMKSILDLHQYGNPSLIPNVISKNLAYFVRVFSNDNGFIADAIACGAIILIMGVVGYAITMCSQYLAARASVTVGTEVRESLYNKVLSLSKRDREQFGNSRILTTVNSDTYQLQHGVLLFVRLVVRVPFILLFSLIISFILDWKIGLSFTIIVPLILLVNVLILAKTRKNYIEIQKGLDDISKSTSEISDGARVVRASNSQKAEIDKFEVKTLEYQNRSIKVNKINALINPLTFAITSLILVVIVFLLRDNLFSGVASENTIISSTIIAEMSYLAQIFFVTVQLTQAGFDIIKASVSRRRINDLLAVEPSIKEADNPVTSSVDKGEEIIRFDHVYFSYDEKSDNYALTDIDFLIKKGETFGIIGGTGSGKTTLINLIERFYDSSKGDIYYKGNRITDYKLTSLRNDIGLVNQKSSLFKGTIKSNYLMANENASDEDIIEALSLAEAYEFVGKYEDGINHEVNEGGHNFSGGQRQRLCIGRALVRKPEILILDDSTSALDLLTDKKVRENISSFEDMTKVIVSQRVSTVQNADYIIVLDEGRIVGKGKHEDLLKECPIYLEIYKTQIKKD